nr:hypothetical protein [Tanacetum cinerariifolium]
MMLADAIKQSKAYKAFIGYSTGLIPPKKTRGKGSQGKKQPVTSKKKSPISTDDNIIHKPDFALELEKSISQTKAQIAEEERRLHETYERLVSAKPTGVDESDESDGEPANRPIGRKRPSGITFRDSSNVSKKKLHDRSQKLKGIQVMTKEERLKNGSLFHVVLGLEAGWLMECSPRVVLFFHSLRDGSGDLCTIKCVCLRLMWYSSTFHCTYLFLVINIFYRDNPLYLKKEERLAANTKKDIKADKEALRLQQHIGDSSEGAGITPEVLDELTSIFTTLSEEAGIVPEVPNEVKGSFATKADAKIDWGSEDDSHYDEEEEQANEDQAQENQVEGDIVGTLVTMSQKEKPEVPRSSSSHSLSSNYDVQIQQEIPPVLLALLLDILVSVIPLQTTTITPTPMTTPLPTTPITTPLVKPSLPATEALDAPDDMDKAAAAANLSTQAKRKHDDKDEDLTAGSYQGKEKERPRKDTQPSNKSSTSKESCKCKTSSKTSKSGKSITAEEPDEERVHDVSIDAEENIVDEMEWNTCQVVDDQPKQTWFNDLVSTQKDSLTFDEHMATLIDFSKFAKNRLKLDKITKEVLVGPALSDQLDWANPEGDRCLFDLSKPLPLKGRPGHLTVRAEYFFNNNLEYLKCNAPLRKEDRYILIMMFHQSIFKKA